MKDCTHLPRTYSTRGSNGRRLAEVHPASSLIYINVDAFDEDQIIEFLSIGLWEDLLHAQRGLLGLFKFEMKLTLENQMMLRDLLLNRIGVYEAKKTITDNELFLEKLYADSVDLVEIGDKFTLYNIVKRQKPQNVLNEVAEEIRKSEMGSSSLSQERIQKFVEKIAEENVTNYKSDESRIHNRLSKLETHTDSWLLPKLAVDLALDIPLNHNTDPEAIDFEEQFFKISDKITSSDNDNEVRQLIEDCRRQEKTLIDTEVPILYSLNETKNELYRRLTDISTIVILLEDSTIGEDPIPESVPPYIKVRVPDDSHVTIPRDVVNSKTPDNQGFDFEIPAKRISELKVTFESYRTVANIEIPPTAKISKEPHDGDINLPKDSKVDFQSVTAKSASENMEITLASLNEAYSNYNQSEENGQYNRLIDFLIRSPIESGHDIVDRANDFRRQDSPADFYNLYSPLHLGSISFGGILYSMGSRKIFTVNPEMIERNFPLFPSTNHPLLNHKQISPDNNTYNAAILMNYLGSNLINQLLGLNQSSIDKDPSVTMPNVDVFTSSIDFFPSSKMSFLPKGSGLKEWGLEKAWENYVKRANSIADQFKATEVPSEDELMEIRESRMSS